MATKAKRILNARYAGQLAFGWKRAFGVARMHVEAQRWISGTVVEVSRVEVKMEGSGCRRYSSSMPLATEARASYFDT